MPTIAQLSSADAISPSDLIPISQGGSVHAVSVGALFAQTQPAIIVEPPSLLGRISIGPGGPDVISIGNGLTLNNGTLNASGFDPTALSLQTTLSPTDLIIVTNGIATQLISLDQIRGSFTSNGTTSTSTPGVPGTNYLTELSPVTGLAEADLVGISQGGQDHTITYEDLLDGLTIDLAQGAGTASDDDTFWVGQTTNVMLRQTLGALWPWISEKMSLWKRPVIELSANTTLDGIVHNNAILVCSASVLISALPANLGSGFSCDLINASSGSVTLASTIITSNGSSTLSLNQSCAIRCVTYSGGTAAFASIGLGSVAIAAPGQISSLTDASLTSSSITLSWSVPATGGTVLAYIIQYRVTGTTSWLPAGEAGASTSFTVSGLQAATSYDFAVSAENSVGTGPISSTITATTPSGSTLPSAPTNVTITNVTVSAVTCSWTAPAIGSGVVYGVQYSLSGQAAWVSAASALSGTSTVISSLAAATAYDIRVTASNSAGSGPASALITITTAAAQGAGLVSSITWAAGPSGSFVHGTGAIGVNAHVNPAGSELQFGFSMSPTVPPTTWTGSTHVNSDFWGAYVPTPATAGTWYGWAEGTDGSSPTVYPTPFTVT